MARQALASSDRLRAALGGAAAGLLLAALALAVPFREHVLVLAGNLRFAGGERTRAIVSYKGVDDRFAAYATYNLAATYAALGEGKAAERLLAELTDRATDAELLFRISFDRANLAFARGDYRAALLGFRRALAMRGHDRAAKRNLELALRRLAAEQAPAAPPAAEQDGAIGDGAQQLLRFAVQQEDTVWGSRSSGGDTADSW